MRKLLRKTTYTFLLLFFSLHSYAQNYVLKDSTIVDSLIQESMKAYYISPKDALPIAQQALYISNNINYINGKWQCYNALGNIHRVMGNTDSANYYAEKNIDFHFSLGSRYDSISAYIEYINLAGTFYKQGEILKGLDYCKTAMAYLDAVNDTHGMMSVRGQLSYLYLLCEDFETSRQYSNEQLDLIRSLTFYQAKARTASAYRNIGNTYLQEKEYEKSEIYLDSALNIFIEIKDTLDILITDNLYGELYVAMNEYEKALPHILNAKKLSSERRVIEPYAGSLFLLQRYYTHHNQIDSALYYGEKSLEMATQAGNSILLEFIYFDLADLYEKKGNKDKAIELLRKHITVSDSLRDESVYRALQTEIFEEELAKAEYDKLKAQTETKDKNKTIQELGILGTLSIIAIIIMLTLGFNLHKKRKQLHNANANLQKNNEVKNKLLAIISHDIRSPLASLYSVIKLSKSDGITPEEIKELVNKLEGKFNATLNLVDNLLYWTKNQINAITPEFTEFNINDVINNNIESITSVANDKGITIKANLADDNIVNADKNMIDIAIRNLVSNAIKFTKKGGEITLTTSQHKNKLKVAIIDTGVGMSEEKIHSLFNANNTSELGTNKEKGTGLGLLVSYEFIKSNNSQLFVSSSLGKGTTFYFELNHN